MTDRDAAAGRQAGLEIHPQHPDRGLDRLHGAVIGHPEVAVIHRLDAADGQFPFDLGPSSVHQHQPDPERVQEGDVPEQPLDVRALAHLTRDHDDHGAAVVRMDVGCGPTQRRDKGLAVDGRLTGGHVTHRVRVAG